MNQLQLERLNHYEGVLAHIEAFPGLPPEAVLKQDILREGLSFSADSLRIAQGYKPKDYFIFSFDLIPIKDMQQEENLKAPEEIRFYGGESELRPTVVSVRVNPASPWKLDLIEGRLVLCCEESVVCEVEYHPQPPWYAQSLQSGKAVSEIAPVLEWGYLVYMTVYRMCQYFNAHEQCQFCDLNRNYEQQRKAGRPYTAVKSVDEILEALDLIAASDQEATAITVTGGSIINKLRSETEAEFYTKYARAIRQRFQNRFLLKAVVQAFELHDVRQLRDAGYDIYHPNFEVWDSKLFDRICPGKARVIGRDGWLHRIENALEVFDASAIIPNFVGGVEMNRDYGFASVDAAIESTAEGLDWFMSRRIMPRFTSWCPEPYAALGPQPAPPLEYFCRLLEVFAGTFRKYELPDPRGYGPTGAGKAVFSVSAFMDVL